MKSAALVIRDGRQFHASLASITSLAPSTAPLRQALVSGTLVLPSLLLFVPLQRNCTGHLSAGLFMNTTLLILFAFIVFLWLVKEPKDGNMCWSIHLLSKYIMNI